MVNIRKKENIWLNITVLNGQNEKQHETNEYKKNRYIFILNFVPELTLFYSTSKLNLKIAWN